jgi:NitT/TauT family transport system ATP-binding protein
MSEPLLEARRLSLDFGAQRVLAGVDLALRAGEIVAVLGASGAGKSSLLRVLGGIKAASGGRLELFGAPLGSAHPAVAMAFQNPCLLPWLDVEQNVAFGLTFARQPQLDPAERRRRVAEALSEVELAHAARCRSHELSGGMAQRVSLARCLARRPAVLLLDEPFGALDAVTRAAMQRLLLRSVRRWGPAVVLVTHDIDEALFVADRVVLLGGTPATVRQTWTLEQSHPRDEALEQLASQRREILGALRESFAAAVPSTPS